MVYNLDRVNFKINKPMSITYDLEEYFINNPDKTVEEAMKKYKVSKEVAFATMKIASKKLNK